MIEKSSQLSDFIVFASYDLILLLVDQVPVLVLLNYELLELLILCLLLLEGLGIFLNLHAKLISALYDRHLVLLQFFELFLDVISRLHLLVESNNYGPEVVEFDVSLIHGAAMTLLLRVLRLGILPELR